MAPSLWSRLATSPLPRDACRLNADFFTQLQRVTAKTHNATITALVKDVVSIYGTNFDLTLEQYFTQLKAMF